jgi:hypothetical protein
MTGSRRRSARPGVSWARRAMMRPFPSRLRQEWTRLPCRAAFPASVPGRRGCLSLKMAVDPRYSPVRDVSPPMALVSSVRACRTRSRGMDRASRPITGLLGRCLWRVARDHRGRTRPRHDPGSIRAQRRAPARCLRRCPLRRPRIPTGRVRPGSRRPVARRHLSFPHLQPLEAERICARRQQPQ